MAISKVQSDAHGHSVPGDWTTVAVNWVSTPTAGNFLIAIGRGIEGTISNASISGYTLATSAICGTNGAVGIWYKIADGTEESATLVWTSATSSIGLSIEEWTPFNAAPLDKTAFTNNTGGTTSRSSGTTDSTTVDDELCIATIGWGGDVSGLAWTNSYATEYSYLTTGYRYAYSSLVVSSTGAQETTASWTTSRVNGCCIATFKGAVVSTWIPKVIMVM